MLPRCFSHHRAITTTPSYSSQELCPSPPYRVALTISIYYFPFLLLYSILHMKRDRSSFLLLYYIAVNSL